MILLEPGRLQRELRGHRCQCDERQQQREYFEVPGCDNAMCSRPSTSAIRGGESLTPEYSTAAISTRIDISNAPRLVKSAGIHS